nr:PREDICTED: uncharacterized protein LOC109033846 [Bemisia tabaci]
MNGDNPVQKYVCCLLNDNNPDHKLRVKSEWREREGTLTILEENNAWTGKFGPEQISLWSKLLGKTEEDYFQETLKMLTSTAESSASYTLDKSSFTWKKKVDGDLKIKFGSIALESIPIPHIANEFIDILLSTNKKLNKRIATLKNSIAAHQTVQNNLRHRLESYPALIEEEEKALYQNFLHILNAEKDKICSLHKKLDNRFNVKDVLLSHSSILENFDESSKNDQPTTSNPYDSETDVDTEEEPENDVEVESNATNSQKSNSQNSMENFALDDSQNSPVLVLSRKVPSTQTIKSTKSESMIVDPAEPGPSSAKQPSSPPAESKKHDEPETKESPEVSSHNQLMYSTQDLFDDL